MIGTDKRNDEPQVLLVKAMTHRVFHVWLGVGNMKPNGNAKHVAVALSPEEVLASGMGPLCHELRCMSQRARSAAVIRGRAKAGHVGRRLADAARYEAALDTSHRRAMAVTVRHDAYVAEREEKRQEQCAAREEKRARARTAAATNYDLNMSHRMEKLATSQSASTSLNVSKVSTTTQRPKPMNDRIQQASSPQEALPLFEDSFAVLTKCDSIMDRLAISVAEVANDRSRSRNVGTSVTSCGGTRPRALSVVSAASNAGRAHSPRLLLSSPQSVPRYMTVPPALTFDQRAAIAKIEANRRETAVQRLREAQHEVADGHWTAVHDHRAENAERFDHARLDKQQRREHWHTRTPGLDAPLFAHR
jgi:hypothetical protein